MVVVGEPVYNTEQRREMLRQMKEYLDEQWLKRKAKGKLSKKKIILPNAEVKKEKRKIKIKIRLFKLVRGKKRGNQIVFKEIKIIKRKNRKYKK